MPESNRTSVRVHLFKRNAQFFDAVDSLTGESFINLQGISLLVYRTFNSNRSYLKEINIFIGETSLLEQFRDSVCWPNAYMTLELLRKARESKHTHDSRRYTSRDKPTKFADNR